MWIIYGFHMLTISILMCERKRAFDVDFSFRFRKFFVFGNVRSFLDRFLFFFFLFALDFGSATIYLSLEQ